MTSTKNALSFTPRFFTLNGDGKWQQNSRISSGKSSLMTNYITDEASKIIKEGGEICKHPSDELAANFL